MRTNMDPLTPTTSTLAPAIAHIAETAAALAAPLRERDISEDEVMMGEKERQRQVVRWVLGAPKRLKGLVDGGKREEAMRDWEEVKRLLERWRGVQGVDEVRQECLAVVDGEATDDDNG
ncbi:MAG: hypothetical protein Q9209_007956 [Squamulea sp. 1 TL-2023]